MTLLSQYRPFFQHILLAGSLWLSLGNGPGQNGTPRQQLDFGERVCATGSDEARALEGCRTFLNEGGLEAGQALPSSELFYLRIGKLLEERLEWQAAHRLYREGTSRFPSNAQLHYLLARVLTREMAANLEAIGPASQAVRLAPQDYEKRLLYADVLRSSRRTAEAVREYRRVLRHMPTHEKARRGLGLSLVALNETNQAVRELERALQVAPESWETRRALVRAKVKLGQFASALSLLAAAAQLPGEVTQREVRCEVSMVLLKAGRCDEGREECRKAQALPSAQHGTNCDCANERCGSR